MNEKDLSEFFQRNFKEIYPISSEQFTLVSNLNPMDVSDQDFLRITEKFNNEEFVRAAYKAYLKQEVSEQSLKFWTTDIELKRKRIIVLIALKKTDRFQDIYSIKNIFFSKLFQFENSWILYFCFSLIRLIQKIFFGLNDIKILSIINLIPESTDEILGTYIDRPKKGDKIKQSKLWIAGWFVPKKSQSVTIRLIDKKVLSEVPLIVPRPDVTSFHCLQSTTHLWGFSIYLDIKDLPDQGELQLQAIFKDSQKIVPISRIKYLKV
ncbi:hypothetical protein NO976_00346 [Planktothrix agardhii]|jgi:hypothetical protein|uniref:hypothetical protein n=1 Tax=Planktothrix agardhii TaxID=1160 RepID=UPI0020A7137B|nr:hypothetical protein [Planktothrix agardhii]CAD5915702.1 hypothetical protein NO976_00346 [Planktothrix agardhii]